MFGLGRRSVAALENLGLRTIGQLAACPVSLLQPVLGKQAEEIRNRARGLDDRPVVPDEQRKSLGKETTFGEDLMGKGACLEALWDLCQQVGWRLRVADFSGYTVTLKIKTARFQLITRSRTVEEPVQLDEELREQIRLLADQVSWREPGSQRQPPDTRWQCGPGSGWQWPGPEAGPGPGRLETAVRGRHHP